MGWSKMLFDTDPDLLSVASIFVSMIVIGASVGDKTSFDKSVKKPKPNKHGKKRISDNSYWRLIKYSLGINLISAAVTAYGRSGRRCMD